MSKELPKELPFVPPRFEDPEKKLAFEAALAAECSRNGHATGPLAVVNALPQPNRAGAAEGLDYDEAAGKAALLEDDGPEYARAIADIAKRFKVAQAAVKKRVGRKRAGLLAERAELEAMERAERDREAQANALAAATWQTEPPQPVDGAALLEDVRAFLTRFVVFKDEHQPVALALWSAHTYAIASACTTGYLHVHSPEKQSGKTRLFEVLEVLVAQPWLVGRTSVAALVRKVAGDRCVLLLDESDAAFGGDKVYAESLRGVLNAGYRRGGKASLCVGDASNIEVKDFDVFGPKAFAGIGKSLPDTVLDRSIPIELRRRLKTERRDPFKFHRVDPQAEPLRNRLATWARAHLDALRNAEPEFPTGLSDRAEEAWEPLLAIADRCGGDWPGRGRAAAAALSGAAVSEDASNGVKLLGDVKRAFEGFDEDHETFEAAERLHTQDMLRRLHRLPEAPWATWLQGKPLTDRGLAGKLRTFGIRSKQVRIGETNRNGYESAWFEDAWARYLPEMGSGGLQCLQPLQDKGLRLISQGLQNDSVEDAQCGANPHGIRDVGIVEDKNTKTAPDGSRALDDDGRGVVL